MATILIVDDAKFNRTLLNRGLTKAKHNVIEAENGLLAEQILDLQHASIDLVICDISMPVQDGITTLTNIRKKFGDLPVVMLTAFSDKENVLKCAKLGISGFLAKPFDIKRVRSKIMEILGTEEEPEEEVESEDSADETAVTTDSETNSDDSTEDKDSSEDEDKA